MPQHDMIIANGSGAAVRADINDALAALGSTMKGPNAPPAPIAGMMWLDDDTPSASVWTLKMYDGADWISIATFDISANTWAPSISLLRLAAGTAGAPAYSFSGDTDTGIYSAGAGNVDIAANGQRVLSLTNSGGANFATLENSTGNLVAALYMSLKDASATVSRASFIAAVNENFVPVSAIGKNLSTDGSSNIVLSATPAGARNTDRRVIRMTIPGSGAITVAGPLDVTSGGQTITGNLEASGNLRFNSGFGSAGLAFGVRGWASVTVAAGAPTMDANGNFTSITDNGAGDFTFNFTSNMPDTHYAVAGSAVGQTNTAGVQPGLAVNTANGQPLLKSTSQVRIGLYRADANSYVDAATFSIMIVR